LLKTGSAFYSPATAAIRMAESYLKDKQEVLPCAAYLEGEYGYSGFYLGVPARIGAGGVEQVVQLTLTDDEARQLEVSASHVKELVDALDKVLGK
jgi:malate dehydrogenase